MIPNWCEGVYAEWAKADPFWFVPGKFGYDRVKHQSIISFGDIADDGRFLAQSRIDDSQITMAKVWYAYKVAERLMQDVNTHLLNTVHQNVCMIEPSEWPIVERVANIVFGGHIPSTTIIPCDDLAYHFRQDLPPYLPPNEVVRKFRITETVEIDLVGVVG